MKKEEATTRLIQVQPRALIYVASGDRAAIDGDLGLFLVQYRNGKAPSLFQKRMRVSIRRNCHPERRRMMSDFREKRDGHGVGVVRCVNKHDRHRTFQSRSVYVWRNHVVSGFPCNTAQPNLQSPIQQPVAITPFFIKELMNLLRKTTLVEL